MLRLETTCAAVAAAALSLTLGPDAQANGPTVLYSQFPQVDDGFPSDGVGGQFYDQRIADDFLITQAQPINSVSWIGGSEAYFSPEPGNVSLFVIEFFADGGGVPGDSLMRATVSLAESNPVALGADGLTGATLYRHTYEFEDMNVSPGVYYFSVSTVNVDPAGDAWIWNSSGGALGNDAAFADVEVTLEASFEIFPLLTDMAFEVTRNIVPAFGDLDCDGQVGMPDLQRVIDDFGTTDESPADISGPAGEADGVVDIDDFIAILLAWS